MDLKEKINKIIDEAQDNRTNQQIAKEQIILLEDLQSKNSLDKEFQIRLSSEIRQWLAMV